MMAITEQQYERIALWLDGQDVTLTDAERALADEIRRDEALVGPAADVRAPRSALDRASRRMAAELARPARRLRIGRFVAVAAAAAAAIIVATALLMPDPAPVRPDTPGGDDSTVADVDTLIDEMEESIRPEMMVELLAGDLESLEAEMLVTAEIGEMDLEIHALEDEIDSILLDPSAPWSFDDGV